jgi:methionyl-tRNA formyltransferase
MGGKQAGCMGLLTLCAFSGRPKGVIAYDDNVRLTAMALGLRVFESIRDEGVKQLLNDSNLLVSVHGREIVSPENLALPSLGGINVHPCLYGYKGPDPINRLLNDHNPKASVGVHVMTDKVDEGEVLFEQILYIPIDSNSSSITSVEEIYNKLYPLYGLVLMKGLETISDRYDSISAQTSPRPESV